MSLNFWRQQDILNPKEISKYHFDIIGAGAVGSYTVMNLAKMGATDIRVFDPDTIEEHNIANQFYPLFIDSSMVGISKTIGMPKVLCLKHIIGEFTDTDIEACDYVFDDKIELKGIVITALDSMAVRKVAFEKCKYNPAVKLFIDPRMGGTDFRIYEINPMDSSHLKFYEANWYSDETASQVPCTAQAIVYNVSSIAGLVGHMVGEFIKTGVVETKEWLFDYRNLWRK